MSDPTVAAWVRLIAEKIAILRAAVDEMTFVGMSADMKDQFDGAINLAERTAVLAETGVMPAPPPRIDWNTG
jgi:hypothetical protein